MNYLVSKEDLVLLCRKVYKEGTSGYLELSKKFIEKQVDSFLENKKESNYVNTDAVDSMFKGILNN